MALQLLIASFQLAGQRAAYYSAGISRKMMADDGIKQDAVGRREILIAQPTNNQQGYIGENLEGKRFVAQWFLCFWPPASQMGRGFGETFPVITHDLCQFVASIPLESSVIKSPMTI